MNKISAIVKCPQCQKKHAYDTNNEYRPFCSERCKLIDFNEWASDGYGIPAEGSNLEQNQTDFDED